MKKILGLTIAAVLIIGMVGGGTWAYFSDTESSTGNTFTAGTLNLDLNGVDTEGVSFTFNNIVPGDSGNLTWEITNTGSIPGYVDLVNISVVNAENPNEATDGAEAASGDDPAVGGELGVNMIVTLFWDDGESTAGNGMQDTGEALIYSGDLDGMPAGVSEQDYLLGNGDMSYICLLWSVSDLVENEIMGDSAVLDMYVQLAQTAGQ